MTNRLIGEARTFVVVLEDDPRRINVMRRALHDALPMQEAVFFDGACELLSWLPGHLDRVSLISLDCDLDATTARDAADAGSGLDVAEDWRG